MKPRDPLADLLASLAVPASDPQARDHALQQAVAAMPSPRRPEPGPHIPWWHHRLYGVRTALGGLAVAALLMAAALVVSTIQRAGPGQDPARITTVDRLVLGQMQALFGSQLSAVVQRPGVAPEIHLSDDSSSVGQASLAQPVTLCFDASQGRTTRVISYSGRHVCVQLAGRRICFETLVTGAGEVMLVGDRFCWTSGQTLAGLEPYRLTAQTLRSL